MFDSDACKDLKIALVNWHDYAQLRWVWCQHKGGRLDGAMKLLVTNHQVDGELLSGFFVNK